MKEITKQDALDLLRARVAYETRIKDLATEFGVSQAFMGAVLAGQKRMTDPMLASIGVTRKTVYVIDPAVQIHKPAAKGA